MGDKLRHVLGWIYILKQVKASKIMFGTQMLMLKMNIFDWFFCGKFEQKTQKSICLQNQWKLKNINKAIVVKNMISN